MVLQKKGDFDAAEKICRYMKGYAVLIVIFYAFNIRFASMAGGFFAVAWPRRAFTFDVFGLRNT